MIGWNSAMALIVLVLAGLFIVYGVLITVSSMRRIGPAPANVVCLIALAWVAIDLASSSGVLDWAAAVV